MNDEESPLVFMSLDEVIEEANAHRAEMDRVFAYDPELNVLIIGTEGGYEVDLDRIKGHADLLAWVRHLLEKAWMNEYLVIEFIDRVEKIKRWPLSRMRMN
jgi:hypothetical protein